MPKRYYIAYGSNLNVEQMRHRCPDARVASTQDSSRVTFSFAWHSAKWQRKYAPQAPNPSRTKIPSMQ